MVHHYEKFNIMEEEESRKQLSEVREILEELLLKLGSGFGDPSSSSPMRILRSNSSPLGRDGNIVERLGSSEAQLILLKRGRRSDTLVP